MTANARLAVVAVAATRSVANAVKAWSATRIVLMPKRQRAAAQTPKAAHVKDVNPVAEVGAEGAMTVAPV